jgi:hypothetical protein
VSDPAFAVQKAIFDALKGATDAGDNVYDAVLATNPFPRITFGPSQTVPVDEQADPNCGYDPTEVTQEMNVWSQRTGYPEAKTIASQVRELLHGVTLSLVGFQMELPLTLRSSDASLDPDGKTHRVRMLFETRTSLVDSG